MKEYAGPVARMSMQGTTESPACSLVLRFLNTVTYSYGSVSTVVADSVSRVGVYPRPFTGNKQRAGVKPAPTCPICPNT
jgi:hypothetical protein